MILLKVSTKNIIYIATSFFVIFFLFFICVENVKNEVAVREKALFQNILRGKELGAFIGIADSIGYDYLVTDKTNGSVLLEKKSGFCFGLKSGFFCEKIKIDNGLWGVTLAKDIFALNLLLFFIIIFLVTVLCIYYYSSISTDSRLVKRFAVLSHDLRSPFATMKRVASSSIISEEKALISLMERQFKRIISTMDDILFLSGKRDEEKYEIIDILELLKDLIFLQGAKNEITMNYDSSESILVKTNYSYLSRMLLNLISNAVKHKDEIAVINIKKNHKEIFIDMSNDIGKVKASGCGIGLKVVHKYAKLLLVDLEVDSSKTVFYVRLKMPRVASKIEFVDIVVLDDENEMAESIKEELLRSNIGTSIYTVSKPQEYLERFRAKILITDRHGPTFDVVDDGFIEEVKKRDKPFVILRTSDHRRVESVDCFLSKMDNLPIDEIKAYLSSSSQIC